MADDEDDDETGEEQERPNAPRKKRRAGAPASRAGRPTAGGAPGPGGGSSKLILLVVGGLLLAVVVLGAALANKGNEPDKADTPARTPTDGQDRNQAAPGTGTDVEHAKAKMLTIAEKMGHIDSVFAKHAIDLRAHNAGWKTIDDTMVKVTPETRAAYQEWRAAVLAGE